MNIDIVADHSGFELKVQLTAALKDADYEVMDFGDRDLDTEDNYTDFVVPLVRVVSSGKVARGIAICGSGVGDCVAANKVPGVREELISDSFFAHQRVKDNVMNGDVPELSGHLIFLCLRPSSVVFERPFQRG